MKRSGQTKKPSTKGKSPTFELPLSDGPINLTIEQNKEFFGELEGFGLEIEKIIDLIKKSYNAKIVLTRVMAKSSGDRPLWKEGKKIFKGYDKAIKALKTLDIEVLPDGLKEAIKKNIETLEITKKDLSCKAILSRSGWVNADPNPKTVHRMIASQMWLLFQYMSGSGRGCNYKKYQFYRLIAEIIKKTYAQFTPAFIDASMANEKIVKTLVEEIDRSNTEYTEALRKKFLS